MTTIEIHKTRRLRQKYHFRVVAGNGEILCTSEKYHNLLDCTETAALVAKGASKIVKKF